MKKIIVLGISSLLLWNCNDANEKSTQKETTETTAPVETTAHHHNDSDGEAIELNNGERWLVNDEMKPFVTTGEDLVEAYLQDNKTDYKALAERLKEQNIQLIESCTMDGKSHDELHKWLHPHLELVKELEQEGNTEKANGIVSQLQHSYKDYHTYFN